MQATVRAGDIFASDLSEHDFEVYEGGLQQAIRLFGHEDIPVTVGPVTDQEGNVGTQARFDSPTVSTNWSPFCTRPLRAGRRFTTRRSRRLGIVDRDRDKNADCH